jgi:fimbrial chaperone protein
MRDLSAAASCLGLALLGLASVPALGGSFSVSPMRVSLSAAKPVAALMVHNEGTEPSIVQLELVAWAQADNADVYVETADVLATPPILNVPPGGSRVVRIGMRRTPDRDHELTYRMFIQEVPPPLAADFEGMRMILRVGVPVFIEAAAKSKAQLQWRSVASADDGVKLTLTNSGTAHVKITDLELSAVGEARASGVQHVSTYVLPGQSHDWIVKMDGSVAAGSKIRVRAHSDSPAEFVADLTLEGS